MIQELSTCIEKPWIENDDVVATPVLSDWVNKPTPGVQPMRPTLTPSSLEITYFPALCNSQKVFPSMFIGPQKRDLHLRQNGSERPAIGKSATILCMVHEVKSHTIVRQIAAITE